MRRTVRQAAALAAAGVLAALPATVLAGEEVHPGEQSWLGLTGADIPDLLKTVAANPYKAPAEPACETIPAEILALNEVLGSDVDQAAPKKSYVAAFAVRQVKGAVRGLVPYRGAIRFLTGADRKDHELVAAAQAGYARRGFLRGLEANLHCGDLKQVAAPAATDEPVTTVASAQVSRLPAAYAPDQPAPRIVAADVRTAAPEAPAAERTDIAAVMLAPRAEPLLAPPGR